MVNIVSNPYYYVQPIVAFLVSLILVSIVLRWGQRSSGKLLFIGVLLSMSVWDVLIFGMRSSPDVHHALLWDRPLTLAFPATFVLYYHFTLVYTNNRGQRPFLFTSYLLLIAFASLVPTDLVVERMRIEDYGYAPDIGLMAPPILMAGFLWMAGGAYNLVKRYRSSFSDNERNRLLYLAVALVFPLVGSVIDGVTNLPPMNIWGNLIFSILCSIAILRYHLLDIHVIVRKSLAYIIISSIIAVPYIGLLFVLQYLFRPKLEPWWTHGLLLLLFAIFLRPLYSWAQNLVDRLFYRGRYDGLRALQQFAYETKSITDSQDLASTLVRLVGDALKSSSVCLLLPNIGKSNFAVVSHVGLEVPPSGIAMAANNRIIRWCKQYGPILSSREMGFFPALQNLTHMDKKNIEEMKAELFIPIKIRGGELSGVLVLGQKLGQQLYSAEDRQILSTIANQIAVVLENARLFNLERTMRRELEKLDEQKTMFLHHVAHELKTPLTATISSSELLSEKSTTDQSFRERLIENIRHSAQSMDRRVTELLHLAEMQIGELGIKPEPLEVAPIITEAASQLNILYKGKKQTLTIEIPDSLPKVNVDKGKLEQVLFNLLSNANKFSPAGSEIILRVSKARGRIIVEVEDSAPAIAEEERSRIFDAYYRSDDPKKRDGFSGLGLGLSISKKLVELHKGEIWIKKKSAKGNIFVFSLPVLKQRTKGAG